MTHHRNFYFEKVSSRSASPGGATQTGPHYARTQRDSNSFAGALPPDALGNIDPDFHRGNIDALLNAARILGALDSAGTKGEG